MPNQDQPCRRSSRLFAEGSLASAAPTASLLERVCRNDELAFEALVERHAARVLGICRRALDDPGDLDDAFQATFLVLARRSRAIRQREDLGSWLAGVSRRVCLLANRAAARRRKHERRAAEQRGARAVKPSAHNEAGAMIHEEIERLPSAYRLPVVLCLMQGRTRSEAAAELRWTEGMVRGRLVRGGLLRGRLLRSRQRPAQSWQP